MSECERCGQPVSLGDWPWCPHGHGNNLQKPMEPHSDEMLGGGEFRTIGEKVRYMDRHSIVPRDEYRRPTPHSPLRDGDIRAAIHESIQELRR